jgi:CBS domain containing-hemolysin-like protein
MHAGDKGSNVDTSFWSGILVAALLSVPLSIFSNIYSDRVREFLEKRKRIRLSNKKARELQTYCLVKALREGDPTATTIFSIDQTLSNRMLILTCTSVGVSYASLLIYLTPLFSEHIPKQYFIAFMVVTGLGVMFFHYYSTVLHARLIQIKYKLMWFDDYEQKIRTRWGDDAL